MLAKLALLKSVPLTYVAAAAVGTVGAVGAAAWHFTRAPAPTELAAAATAPAPVPKAPQVAPQAAQPAKPDAPAFDVARIEPTGEAVIAGRAAPGAKVELLRDGQVHDQTVADKSGEFVLIPKPLPRGAYDLSLRATERGGEQVKSKDSVAVALGADAGQRPVVALVAPDKPVEVLSRPAANAALKVAIDAVESEAAGKLYVAGRTAPGASVRLYLNEAYIASATATREGKVAFAIESGVRPGDYQVRIDEVDGPGGKVQSRAEVPFTAPASGKPVAAISEPAGRKATASLDMSVLARPADTRAPAAPAAPELASSQSITPGAGEPAKTEDAPRALAAAEPPAVVIVPKIDTALVARGDSLWRISRLTYGRGARYAVIYEANHDQIRDPDRIYPGQIFVLPTQQQ